MARGGEDLAVNVLSRNKVWFDVQMVASHEAEHFFGVLERRPIVDAVIEPKVSPSSPKEGEASHGWVDEFGHEHMFALFPAAAAELFEKQLRLDDNFSIPLIVGLALQLAFLL